jgi:hypothetical protein
MLKTDIESELRPTDRTIPIGLIVNELVNECRQVWFSWRGNGTVTVTLKRLPGELRLTVADDGQGLDPREGSIPGSAAAWSTAWPNSWAARSSGRATAGVTTVHLILA